MADGEEDQISAFANGPLQRRKASKRGWTKARREAFLTELAHSCNVTRAHRAAGAPDRYAYALRQRDPQFARAWQQALELGRSEEHTSELQSLMRISYAVFCLKKKKTIKHTRKQQYRQNSTT